MSAAASRWGAGFPSQDGVSVLASPGRIGGSTASVLLTGHIPPISAHLPASSSQRGQAVSAAAGTPVTTTLIPFSLSAVAVDRPSGFDPATPARTTCSNFNFAVAVGALSARPSAPMAPSAPSDARTQGAPRGSATQATEDAAARSVRGGDRGVHGRSGAGSETHFPPAITGSGRDLFHPYTSRLLCSHNPEGESEMDSGLFPRPGALNHQRSSRPAA